MGWQLTGTHLLAVATIWLPWLAPGLQAARPVMMGS